MVIMRILNSKKEVKIFVILPLQYLILRICLLKIELSFYDLISKYKNSIIEYYTENVI